MTAPAIRNKTHAETVDLVSQRERGHCEGCGTGPICTARRITPDIGEPLLFELVGLCSNCIWKFDQMSSGAPSKTKQGVGA